MLCHSSTRPCTYAGKAPAALPSGMSASSMRVATLLTPQQAPVHRCRASRVRRCHRSAPAAAVVAGAVVAEEEGVSEKWWEKGTPNMRDINSIQEMVDVLADAGDHLVIVDFYAQWCGACRALYPKLCKMLAERPDVIFLKVNFDNNKQMAKSLGVKALPFFQFYRGAEGRVASFTCSVSKFQRFREALDAYEAPFCNIEEIPELEEFPDVHAHAQPSKV